MSIFPRPLKKVLDKIIPFSQEDKVPLFNLGSGTYDATTYLRGDGTWSTPSSGSGIKSGTATAAVTDIYTTTIAGVTSYTTNEAYIIKFNTNNVNGATLDINGLGAINLVKNNDVNIIGGDIRVGQEFLVIYDGTNFQMIGIAPNQMFAFVTNDDSVTINKGEPVYAFSASGDRMSVKLANNTSDATSAKTVGLVFSSSIPSNGTGFIITQGVIQNLNTSMYTAGDTLYVGATAGSLTNVKPYAPNHLVYAGIVERANAGNGQIYVRVQNGYELDEIHDVDLITIPPTTNDVLTYNGSLWVAQAPSGGSGTVTSVATSAPITGGPITTSGTIGITQATTSTSGYLSSTDWNTFNGKQDLLISGTNIKTINSTSLLGSGNITINGNPSLGIVTGTNVTGVTAMTKSATITLPANTISAISILEIEARAIRVATLTGTIAFQVYINTSDSLTGATLLGVFNSMTTSNWFTQGRRSLFINPTINNLICVNTGTTVATDFTSTGANGSITFDETLTYYLIFAVQPSSTATTAVVQYAFAKRYV
jgi:hypothetical protein